MTNLQREVVAVGLLRTIGEAVEESGDTSG